MQPVFSYGVMVLSVVRSPCHFLSVERWGGPIASDVDVCLSHCVGCYVYRDFRRLPLRYRYNLKGVSCSPAMNYNGAKVLR